jgi:hypothetical protein
MTPARAGLGEAGCRAARRRRLCIAGVRAGAVAAGTGTIDSRPPALSWRPRLLLAIGSVNGGREGGWVRLVASRRSPWFGLLPRTNRRLCGESVTGNLHSTTTPAPDPSPVVLRMLFMHSSTGLAIWAEIVVLCRFQDRFDGARTHVPLPAPLKGPTPIRAAAAQTRPVGRESTATEPNPRARWRFGRVFGGERAPGERHAVECP